MGPRISISCLCFLTFAAWCTKRMPDDAAVSIAISGLYVFNDFALLALWRASFHIHRLRNRWILTSKQRGTDSAASYGQSTNEHTTRTVIHYLPATNSSFNTNLQANGWGGSRIGNYTSLCLAGGWHRHSSSSRADAYDLPQPLQFLVEMTYQSHI